VLKTVTMVTREPQVGDATQRVRDKELEAYAARKGKVALLKAITVKQRLSPDKYELVHVQTSRGIKKTLLVTKAALKALWEAEAPFYRELGIEANRGDTVRRPKGLVNPALADVPFRGRGWRIAITRTTRQLGVDSQRLQPPGGSRRFLAPIYSSSARPAASRSHPMPWATTCGCGWSDAYRYTLKSARERDPV
jgi:hypothetical protein